MTCRPRPRALALLCSLALAACGGGGGDVTAPVPAGGFYSGTLTVSGSAATAITATVGRSGYAYFHTSGGAYAGGTGINGASLSGTLAWYPYSSVRPFVLTGVPGGMRTLAATVVERTSLDGSLNNGAAVGTLDLNFDAATTDHASSLALLAGTYSRQDPADGYTLTMVIDTAGALSGSSSTGCTYTGTVGAPDAAGTPGTVNNVYPLAISIACPGVATQSAAGLIVRVPGSPASMVLTMSNAAFASWVNLAKM